MNTVTKWSVRALKTADRWLNEAELIYHDLLDAPCYSSVDKNQRQRQKDRIYDDLEDDLNLDDDHDGRNLDDDDGDRRLTRRTRSKSRSMTKRVSPIRSRSDYTLDQHHRRNRSRSGDRQRRRSFDHRSIDIDRNRRSRSDDRRRHSYRQRSLSGHRSSGERRSFTSKDQYRSSSKERRSSSKERRSTSKERRNPKSSNEREPSTPPPEKKKNNTRISPTSVMENVAGMDEGSVRNPPLIPLAQRPYLEQGGNNGELIGVIEYHKKTSEEELQEATPRSFDPAKSPPSLVDDDDVEEEDEEESIMCNNHSSSVAMDIEQEITLTESLQLMPKPAYRTHPSLAPARPSRSRRTVAATRAKLLRTSNRTSFEESSSSFGGLRTTTNRTSFEEASSSSPRMQVLQQTRHDRQENPSTTLLKHRPLTAQPTSDLELPAPPSMIEYEE